MGFDYPNTEELARYLAIEVLSIELPEKKGIEQKRVVESSDDILARIEASKDEEDGD